MREDLVNELFKAQRGLGQMLRAARLSSGIDQATLESQVGVSRSHISKIESGEAAPGVETALKIAAVVGADESAIRSLSLQIRLVKAAGRDEETGVAELIAAAFAIIASASQVPEPEAIGQVLDMFLSGEVHRVDSKEAFDRILESTGGDFKRAQHVWEAIAKALRDVAEGGASVPHEKIRRAIGADLVTRGVFSPAPFTSGTGKAEGEPEHAATPPHDTTVGELVEAFFFSPDDEFDPKAWRSQLLQATGDPSQASMVAAATLSVGDRVNCGELPSLSESDALRATLDELSRAGYFGKAARERALARHDTRSTRPPPLPSDHHVAALLRDPAALPRVDVHVFRYFVHYSRQIFEDYFIPDERPSYLHLRLADPDSRETYSIPDTPVTRALVGVLKVRAEDDTFASTVDLASCISIAFRVVGFAEMAQLNSAKEVVSEFLGDQGDRPEGRVHLVIIATAATGDLRDTADGKYSLFDPKRFFELARRIAAAAKNDPVCAAAIDAPDEDLSTDAIRAISDLAAATADRYLTGASSAPD